MVNSLQEDLGATMTRRLEAKSISIGLGMDLAEVRGTLQAESDNHDLLHVAVGVVFDDLGVARSEGTSSLAARAIDIMARVCLLEENAFHTGITQAFAVARSHYAESIDLETMSTGFAPGYEVFELDEIKTEVTPIARNLANRIKDRVLPRRG